MRKKNKDLSRLIISVVLIETLELIFTLNSWDTGMSFAVLWIALILLFVYSSYKLLIDFKLENQYFKFIFSLFIFYEIIIIIRGWSFAPKDLTTYLRQDIIFWPFLIPFFVFFDKRFSTFVYLLKCFYYLGIVYIVLIVVFPSLLLYRISAETVINVFVPGCGFLLLNAVYLSNKKVIVSFIVVLTGILSVVYLARRSNLSVLVEFILVAYFFNLRSKSPSRVLKMLPLLIIIAAFAIFNLPAFNKKLTNKIDERILEDSRSTLYPNFLKDMDGYMYFGKGLNGTYYFPMEEYELDGEQEKGVVWSAETNRNNAENGYFQLLLNGGVIHIILFILILLPASFYGIFKSSNQFSKACGEVGS